MTSRIVGQKFFFADFFQNREGKSESLNLTVSYRDVNVGQCVPLFVLWLIGFLHQRGLDG